MDFLSVETWSKEEPAHVERGVVLVSVVYSGSLLMDGTMDESLSVRVRDDGTGNHLLLEGVARRGVEEYALDLLKQGVSRDDVWENVVSSVCRLLNRGLCMSHHVGIDPAEDLEF